MKISTFEQSQILINKIDYFINPFCENNLKNKKPAEIQLLNEFSGYFAYIIAKINQIVRQIKHLFLNLEWLNEARLVNLMNEHLIELTSDSTTLSSEHIQNLDQAFCRLHSYIGGTQLYSPLSRLNLDNKIKDTNKEWQKLLNKTNNQISEITKVNEKINLENENLNREINLTSENKSAYKRALSTSKDLKNEVESKISIKKTNNQNNF